MTTPLEKMLAILTTTRAEVWGSVLYPYHLALVYLSQPLGIHGSIGFTANSDFSDILARYLCASFGRIPRFRSARYLSHVCIYMVIYDQVSSLLAESLGGSPWTANSVCAIEVKFQISLTIAKNVIRVSTISAVLCSETEHRRAAGSI